MHLLRPLSLAALLSLCLTLVPSAARADGPVEEFYQSRVNIADGALRGVLGVATVDILPGMAPEVVRYTPVAGSFRPAGTLRLASTRAISGWDYGWEEEYQLLRRYPVVEKRGDYVLAVIDVRTNARAWLRASPGLELTDTVHFESLEDPLTFAGSGVDTFHLSRTGEPSLCDAPRPEAACAPMAAGTAPDAFILLSVEGDYAQVGVSQGPEEPVQPVGWVRVHDAQGFLLLWPVAGLDGC